MNDADVLIGRRVVTGAPSNVQKVVQKGCFSRDFHARFLGAAAAPADRPDGLDAGLQRPLIHRPSPSRGILSSTSLVPSDEREETCCGPGSIFRVRRCNKKQSSQRGVDRRWQRRPRLVRRSRRSPLSLGPIASVSLFIPRVRFYRHDSFNWYLYQQICRSSSGTPSFLPRDL